jgi:serine/threonine-protein phosphatase 2A regulatory subunit B
VEKESMLSLTLFIPSQVLTGSYSNFFGIYDPSCQSHTILQADKSAFKAKRSGAKKAGKSKPKKEEYLNAEGLDLTKKILHASWHPRENTIALAATNNLFLFSQE